MSRNTQRMVLTRNFWLQVAETGLLISVNSNKPGLMLELKLQYFGHLMQRADSQKRPWCWERLKAEGEKGNRGWDGWMASPTQWTWIWANSKRWWGTGKPGLLQSMGSQRAWQNLVTEQQKQTSEATMVSPGVWWPEMWNQKFTALCLSNFC